MTSHFNCCAWLLAICIGMPIVAQSPTPSLNTQSGFEDAIRRFGVDHDRNLLRVACDRALAAESGYALPQFYLGVLDEADENWSSAQKHFEEFLKRGGDSGLSAAARRELDKLPVLIKEDSTENGKLDRQYRQHLGYAELLQKKGFAREALLEAAEAAKLRPNSWEAYAIASSILLSQRKFDQASHFLQLARKESPPSAKGKLDALETSIQRGVLMTRDAAENLK